MATKRASKRSPKKEIETEMPAVEYTAPVVEKKPMSCKKALGLSALGLLAVLAIFWYKTNTWPIAAIANGRVITRYTLNKNLYQQGGKTVLDSLVTEQLVKQELDNKKITVSKDEVNKRYEEIKKTLPAGSDVKALLAAQGMTEADLLKQIELQLRIQKAISGSSTISEDEINKYIEDNKSYLTGTTSAELRASAIEGLKSQKLQSEYTTWMNNLKKNAKVWTPDNSWSVTSRQQ